VEEGALGTAAGESSSFDKVEDILVSALCKPHQIELVPTEMLLAEFSPQTLPVLTRLRLHSLLREMLSELLRNLHGYCRRRVYDPMELALMESFKAFLVVELDRLHKFRDSLKSHCGG